MGAKIANLSAVRLTLALANKKHDILKIAWDQPFDIADAYFNTSGEGIIAARMVWDQLIDTELYAFRERKWVDALAGYMRTIGQRAKINLLQYPALRDKKHSGVPPISFSVQDERAAICAVGRHSTSITSRAFLVQRSSVRARAFAQEDRGVVQTNEHRCWMSRIWRMT
jgi:hypothetical protein